MAAVAAIAGVGMMVCCSSSVASFMMMGDDDDDKKKKTPLGPTGPTGPSAPTTTTFFESEIPNDAMVIDVGEIPMAYMEGDAVIGDFNAPAGSTSTTRTYYLQFQSDGQLVWVKRGTGTQWAMGSVITMPDAKVHLQGDGNICARGTGTDLCMNSAGGARVPTHNNSVPGGQHKIVGTKEGLLYVDHGTGVAGRSVIFTPPTATETYVLPY